MGYPIQSPIADDFDDLFLNQINIRFANEAELIKANRFPVILLGQPSRLQLPLSPWNRERKMSKSRQIRVFPLTFQPNVFPSSSPNQLIQPEVKTSTFGVGSGSETRSADFSRVNQGCPTGQISPGENFPLNSHRRNVQRTALLLSSTTFHSCVRCSPQILAVKTTHARKWRNMERNSTLIMRSLLMNSKFLSHTKLENSPNWESRLENERWAIKVP